MADEALSQAELETLLRAAQSDVAGPLKNMGAPPDFKPPQRVNATQLRTLASLHENFSRGLANALSSYLRSKLLVKLTTVDEITYGEFRASLKDPGYFNVVRVSPLPGQMLLAIDHAVLYPILDRMLGGGREPSALVRRQLTQIELRLAARIATLAIDELGNAWRGIVDLKPAIERVESSSKTLDIAADNEVVAVVWFELALADSRGRMSLCIPAVALPAMGGSAADSESDLVEIVAQLAEAKITAGELVDLQVGDLIATDGDSQPEVELRVDGVSKFRGRLGASKGYKAVRIDETDHCDPR